MTIGIYCIEHVATGRKYIGKSKNIEARLINHKCALRSATRSKDTNRYLWNAVQKYGWDAFKTSILEAFDVLDETALGECELFWMDFYETCEIGFNLRRDTSTKMVVHELTKELLSLMNTGSMNGNYGNKWNDEQRARGSVIAKERHASGLVYGDEWRRKQGENASRVWKNLELKAQMAKKVAESRKKFFFMQCTRDGFFIRLWESVEAIIAAHPEYKWQNIYSVCNGYKPTYMDFVWHKMLKTDYDALI